MTQNEIVMLQCLQNVVLVANIAKQAWNDGDDMRVGRLLTALSGNLPKYRKDIDEIHKTIAELSRIRE